MGGRSLGIVLIALVLAGCEPTPSVTPSPTAPPTPAPTPVAVNLPIVIGLMIPIWAPSPFFSMSNTTAAGLRWTSWRPELATQLVYNGLYRYDETLSAVPDLAAEPCDVAADLVTITCRLVEATFHDGSPLTADDVVFTYELGSRHPDCLWAFGQCYGEKLVSVTALDARTVEFRLSSPDARMLTEVLPNVMIDSRAVVEAAYAPLAAVAPTLDPVPYREAAGSIFALFTADAPDCSVHLENAEALLRAAAIDPLPRDQFHAADGSFDACMYAGWSGAQLDAIGRSLEATGLDAIALAYQALSFNLAPVGTGPFRFAGVVDGPTATFEAFAGYHLGTPATPKIEIRLFRDWAAAPSALKNGELNWLGLDARARDIYADLVDEPGLKFVDSPDQGYYMLAYNLREGMLFSERDVRTAVELCIDKPATVDASTALGGEVIYSPVTPFSWAFEPDLPRPIRDVDSARRLLEAAGWMLGGDGIYERGGRRLATDVLTRGDDAQRVAFMDLVAEQVRACGIELTVVPAFGIIISQFLEEYPHIPSGSDKPFEAVFIAVSTAFDPHLDGWESSEVSSAEQPGAWNFMGFADPRVDALLDEGLATYDQRERARIYRQVQRILAVEDPALFAWAARIHEALDERLTSTDGELNLKSRQWLWQLEKLVLKDG